MSINSNKKIVYGIVAMVILIGIVTVFTGCGDDDRLSDASELTLMPIEAGVPIPIEAGSESSFALHYDGSLWAWGSKHSGQLGDGIGVERQYSPVKIMKDVVAVSAGGRHTLAIKTDGSLWTWGANCSGQRGDSYRFSRYSPMKIMDSVMLPQTGDKE